MSRIFLEMFHCFYTVYSFVHNDVDGDADFDDNGGDDNGLLFVDS